MSTQTPQTDAVMQNHYVYAYDYSADQLARDIAICEHSRTLEADRDHYKALCEELRKAVESAQIAFHFQAIRDAQDAKMCAGWVLLQDQMSAALKKAQKDI
jgi:Flp pilus assembly protein CpaB